MDKKKIVPIVITVLLFIFAIVLFIREEASKKTFSKLTITYHGSETEYTDIEVGNGIVVNNTSFWIASVTEKNMTITTDQELSFKNKLRSDFKIELGKANQICFSENDCITFILA